MREIPGRGDLPVYFLWDEFGNSYLPDADVFATTVRAYQVSLMFFMQGINQLAQTYGRDRTSVILSGVATQISFGAAEQETAEYFERRVGKTRLTQRPSLKDPQLEQHQDRSLISASEIRELPDNTLLVVSDNQKTALIDSTPSHEHPQFRRYMKKRPAPIISAKADKLEFLTL
jgi:type IV secretion system protein VirD4